MQNNIVYSSEEEALRNAGLTQGVAGHLPGQGHHHHHHTHGTQGVPLVGTNVQGVPLVGTEGLTNQLGGGYISGPGTVISDTQYVTSTQYTTGANPYGNNFVGTGVTGVPLGTNLTGTGLPLGTNLTGTGVPLGTNLAGTGTHLSGNQLLGAGALGAGVTGAGIAGAHHHHQGVAGTTGLAPNTALGGTGLGTFVFRPLEGKFLKDKDPIGKMDCYCKFKIGFHSGKSSVAKSEGVNPTWSDVISLNRKHNEQFAKLKIKDKDRLTLNDKVGEVKIPLNEIAAKGRVQQWFNVYKKDQLVGEILLDVEYQPRTVF